jgi:hypothetical protein
VVCHGPAGQGNVGVEGAGDDQGSVVSYASRQLRAVRLPNGRTAARAFTCVSLVCAAVSVHLGPPRTFLFVGCRAVRGRDRPALTGNPFAAPFTTQPLYILRSYQPHVQPEPARGNSAAQVSVNTERAMRYPKRAWNVSGNGWLAPGPA